MESDNLHLIRLAKRQSVMCSHRAYMLFCQGVLAGHGGKSMSSIGDEHPTHPGYFLVGFAKHFRHPVTKKTVYPKKGNSFPIWRRLNRPPQIQLTLL